MSTKSKCLVKSGHLAPVDILGIIARELKNSLTSCNKKIYTFCDKKEVLKMAQSIENMIVSRIYGNKRGWVFTLLLL